MEDYVAGGGGHSLDAQEGGGGASKGGGHDLDVQERGGIA